MRGLALAIVVGAIVVGLCGSSIAWGQDSGDVSLKAWGGFVGKWKVSIDGDESVVATIRKAEHGKCYIHENRELTMIVGWDAELKMLRGTIFFADGGYAVGLWKLVGDAPKFEGPLTVIDAKGKRTETTYALKFMGPDRWEGIIDKVTLFRAERVSD